MSDFSILDASTTTQSVVTLRAYAAALLSDDKIITDSDFYNPTKVSDKMAINNFDKYSVNALSTKYKEQKLIKGMIGVDSKEVNSMQMTIYTIYDVLNSLFQKNMFPEQIKEIFDFSKGTISEKIFYPVLNSFINLKQGYDNYIMLAQKVSEIQTKYADELADKVEYIEILNLMNK